VHLDSKLCLILIHVHKICVCVCVCEFVICEGRSHLRAVILIG